jgi:hypothetical protein
MIGTTWMQTFTGKRVDPLNMQPADIAIIDIAKALGNICRFGGHTRRFYSVAEHSIEVANLVEDKYKLPALLHDAQEAYIGDIIRPIKGSLTIPKLAGYHTDISIYEVDDHIRWQIEYALGFKYEPAWDEIIRADDIMLATEGLFFMGSIEGWNLAEQPKPNFRPEMFDPHTAMLMFLANYEKISGKGVRI